MLGWDSRAGRALTPKGRAPEAPQKYGFHATLMAPFVPAPGITAQATADAVARWAADQAPVTLGALTLVQKYGYLALRPERPEAGRDLAARIVRQFNPLRAPLSAETLARRRRARLSPRQDAQLRDWGYPYVFDDFEFHMTLSGRLPKAAAQTLAASLQPVLDRALTGPLTLDALSVMGEASDGFFHEIDRIPLGRG